MAAFLIVLFALLMLNIIIELCWIGEGKIPQRTPVTIAWCLAGHIALLVWVTMLLVRVP